ncbi:uncharacterized protein FFB20_10641 [Fusarium fujikuroi]|uniref:Uncharacterized protein n=1 Tax=Gibberella fujikuroi (strain CBS 195.34 / IMI 58289 / NRRL A-6831) TaxID=1279085 RepID=S0ENA8_GIBF5|nr:uncharacterized protein FFUJ_11475 [Fusarium fujikuroi IMI 58289]SCN98337.1 uncharacterized protein FFB20_10641 [Fusarium fujikuroi]CCT75454.1 uncharacterized protein FFUJ_11475 [Fusarium fujikuroi IMI 58289]SCO21070.1 uncharacterized protein FFE2_14838 [Fusarium fujikuroi]SCO25976.1 uncharacterized protein FFM5_14393 [Fusarium fujikuroi]SCV59920.1 uncharacterized protein FFFS_14489 [Fusarium fujikuroi]
MAPFQAQQFRQGFVVTLNTLRLMDPRTIAFQIFRLPSPGDLVRNALKERQGLLDRQQWNNRVRLGPGTEHSEVHDIAFTGESRWQTLENPDATLQSSQSIRLTVKEEGSSGPEDTFPVAMGLMELSKQWQQADPNASYHVTTYETEHPVKTTRFIKVSENAQNKSVCITCHTYAREQPNANDFSEFHSAKQITEEIQSLDTSYITVRSEDNWKQVFLLQFHHACLKLFIQFLNFLEKDEIDHAEYAVTDPSKAELRQWNLKTIVKRSYEYRDLAEMGRKFISTTEYLLDVTNLSFPAPNSQVPNSPLPGHNFKATEIELRFLFQEANEQLKKFSDRLDRDLKYLELARNFNQNRSVQQLTLLATVFLPLSLAAGILSMQTRFKDLGVLLYDFFGVVVLLAGIVLIIMIMLNFVAVVKELDSKSVQHKSYRETFRVITLSLVKYELLVFGALLLSSFLVGMFKDASLGARILGYGALAICSPLMVLFELLFGCFVIWHWFPVIRERFDNA